MVPEPKTGVRFSGHVRHHLRSALVALSFCAAACAAWPSAILFDASKHEMAGNADWVIHATSHNLNMPAYPCSGSTNESNPGRFPDPAQSGITPGTPETFWTGGISAWAVELVKAGHTVESLPDGADITFGDTGNPQDLSHYKLFIVVEPQAPFTADEKAAILAFVSAGGGLFMVGDHETSDRDCDTWDSPRVWNDLAGATSGSSAGLFGIWFRVDGSDTKPSEDWFDDGVDDNVTTDPADPIIHGPFGSGEGGIGFFGATSMDLNPANNPSVKAHVWRTGQAHDNNRVTFATATYGSGRVAAIGDSSPADDGTGDPGDTLYDGWDKASGGVNNREIHLNACHWLLNPVPDTTAPAINSGPSVAFSDCSATVTWGTDEPATSAVDYGLTDLYGSSAAVGGYAMNHVVTLPGLTPGATYHFRVSSSDTSGNGPTQSSDAVFTTLGAAAPVITSGPAAAAVTGTSATVAWQTDEPSSSQVEYGTTTSYGGSASTAGQSAAHSVQVAGLTPETLYHYRVLSTDACGNGPVFSADATFTTGPASLDLSGWMLKQFNTALTYTFPAGTTIPSGGYLVVARNATRAQFEATFPSMPAGTVFLNSNATGSCSNGCLPQLNGSETFELWNTTAKVEGPTIAAGENNSYQRTSPCGAPGVAGSWTVLPEASANPGQGAGAPCGAGVVIGEFSDAADYTKEFVELYYDAGDSPADDVPPAAVTDLTATPLSSTTVRLTWTASGDDGMTGQATSYDIRRSGNPILSDTDFDGATQILGEPSPAAAGTPEQFTVTGLAANTPHYFALKVSDEKPNASALSNSAGGTTAPPGGGSANHLVISQVQSGGSGSVYDDEFVEIYNPTGAGVSLATWSIQYKSATGSNFLVRTLSESIPSHGYFLIAQPEYDGAVTEDVTNTDFSMGAAGGNLYLVNGITAIGSCYDAVIVDKVAWGTGNCPETLAAAAPAVENSIMRKPGDTSGCGTDTDNNSQDFTSQVPSAPRNRFSTPATPQPEPEIGNVGASLYLSPGASGTDLRWAGAYNAAGYNVYRGTAPGFMAGAPAPWQSPTATAILDPSAPSPIHFYVVRAVNGTLESGD